MHTPDSAREFELIERIFRRDPKRADVVTSIGDDAAITRLPPGADLVTATDSLVCDTHFLRSEPPESVGHRCLAANLSDLAAMGAEPCWASLSISLPEPDEAWLSEFANGFFALAERFNVDLTGGDTVRGPLAVTVTLQGCVPEGLGVFRSGASAGDVLYVTGTPGDAAAGRLLRAGELQGDASAGEVADLVNRYLFPEPRVEIGIALRSRATAMIDLSDGLEPDLQHMLNASNCGADLELAQLGVSAALARLVPAEQAYKLALGGGEDYELCFAVAPESIGEFEALAAEWPVSFSRVGTVTDTPGLRCLHNGQPFAAPGALFEHFS